MKITPEVFVINLEQRTDRRVAMQKQLSMIGWRARFFPAIRPESAADFPTIGARGCFLSHLSVLKTARDAGTEQLIILEDDVNFAPNFSENWQRAISMLATKTWSLFYPGHSIEGLQAGLRRLAPDQGVQCTHFMAINSQFIPQLIHGLEVILSRPAGDPLGGPMHLDGAYSTLRAQNHALITYAYSPSLGYQRPSRTDVGKLKWFDKATMFRPVVNLARRFRDKVNFGVPPSNSSGSASS